MRWFHWDAYSVVRLVLPLILGIWVALSYPNLLSDSTLWILLLGSLTVVSIFTFIKNIGGAFSFRWLFGLIVTLFFFSSGYYVTIKHYALDHDSHFLHGLHTAKYAILQLNEPLRETDKTYGTQVTVIALTDSTAQQIKPVSGKALVYFKKDKLPPNLQYGDWVLASTKSLKPIEAPRNPFGFDYAKYLHWQNIYHQAYLTPTDWQQLPTNRANWAYKQIFSLRQYCLNAINTYVGNNQEGGVTAALLLGYRSYLERDIVQTYSATGVTHVLAVSGLHVGVIAVAGMWLLGFLDKRGKYGKWLRVLLLIIGIWIFILLAGAPPSAARSGVMLSFILFSQGLARRADIYNTMAGSALLLLLLNPYNLMDVGFQLSYLAVGGIVFFQDYIYRWIKIDNKYLDMAWQVTTVSLAAQLSTLPLILYYFQQFPTYFMLSNFIAVPLSSAILYVGIVFFGVAWWQPLSTMVGKILYYMVWTLDHFLQFVQHLPYSNLQGLVVSWGQMWVLYALIAALTYFGITALPRYLKIGLSLIVVFLTFSAFINHRHQNQRYITAYAFNQKTAIEFTDGQRTCSIATDTLTEAEQLYGTIPYRKHLRIIDTYEIQQNNLNAQLIQHPVISNLAYNKHFMQFYDKTFLVLGKEGLSTSPTQNTHVNYLLLSHNARIKIPELPTNLLFDTLIIDQSNSYRKTQQWIDECMQLNIPYHNMREKGAWIISF